MAECVRVNFDYLFGLAVIGDMTVIIDASIEIPRATLLGWSPSNEDILDLGSLIEDLKTVDESLNDSGFPEMRDLMLIQGSQEISIPNKKLIIFLFLLAEP